MAVFQKLFDMMRAMPVFKPEMRAANREGRKGQTRRVINPQPDNRPADYMRFYPNSTAKNRKHYGTEEHMRRGLPLDFCPYGKAGDICYMREPLYHGFGGVAYYRDDMTMVRHGLTGEPITWRWKKDILTSIFMPKEAARFLYRYEFIRVERVQEISEEDAMWEGLVSPGAKLNYQKLFDKINAKRGFGWNENPWVWVLGYKPVKIFSPGTVGNDIAGLKPNLVIFDDFLGAGDG